MLSGIQFFVTAPWCKFAARRPENASLRGRLFQRLGVFAIPTVDFQDNKSPIASPTSPSWSPIVLLISVASRCLGFLTPSRRCSRGLIFAKIGDPLWLSIAPESVLRRSSSSVCRRRPRLEAQGCHLGWKPFTSAFLMCFFLHSSDRWLTANPATHRRTGLAAQDVSEAWSQLARLPPPCQPFAVKAQPEPKIADRTRTPPMKFNQRTFQAR